MIAVQSRRYGIIIDDGMVVLMMKTKKLRPCWPESCPQSWFPPERPSCWRRVKITRRSESHSPEFCLKLYFVPHLLDCGIGWARSG